MPVFVKVELLYEELVPDPLKDEGMGTVVPTPPLLKDDATRFIPSEKEVEPPLDEALELLPPPPPEELLFLFLSSSLFPTEPL
jgi:hypothetical protein